MPEPVFGGSEDEGGPPRGVTVVVVRTASGTVFVLLSVYCVGVASTTVIVSVGLGDWCAVRWKIEVRTSGSSAARLAGLIDGTRGRPDGRAFAETMDRVNMPQKRAFFACIMDIAKAKLRAR